ncbi:MAG: phytanoyl-CoA dioxygenase family protein [Polyangiales bacterium]
MSESQAREFVERGVMPLRGFVPRPQVAAAREWIAAELERLRLKVNGRVDASKVRDLPVFQQTTRLGQMVRGAPAIDGLFTDDLRAVMDALAGVKLAPAQPQLLLSLPHKQEWSLRALNWHLDLKAPKDDRVLGVQAFVLIDDVKRHGGATLALAGSHRLHHVEPGHGALHHLHRDGGFSSSPEAFLEVRTLCGVPLRIVEMSGRAGDVYLMDLRVLHTPSINAQRAVRMMATNRYLAPR